jgi:hypothetical protein
MEERRPDCQGEFQRIWDRLGNGDKTFDSMKACSTDLDKRVLVLETNMVNLIKSMSSLTKALWGAVVAISGGGITFIIWYIQSLNH